MFQTNVNKEHIIIRQCISLLKENLIEELKKMPSDAPFIDFKKKL